MHACLKCDGSFQPLQSFIDPVDGSLSIPYNMLSDIFTPLSVEACMVRSRALAAHPDKAFTRYVTIMQFQVSGIRRVPTWLSSLVAIGYSKLQWYHKEIRDYLQVHVELVKGRTG